VIQLFIVLLPNMPRDAHVQIC